MLKNNLNENNMFKNFTVLNCLCLTCNYDNWNFRAKYL